MKDAQKCFWPIGGLCDGDITVVDLFPDEEKDVIFKGHSVHEMPICNRHLSIHQDIVALRKDGVDLEENLSMDSEERAEKHRKDMM